MKNITPLANELLSNFPELEKKPFFFSLKIVHDYLSLNSKKSLKTTERLFNDLDFFPKKLSKNILVDENLKNLKSKVQEYWEKKAKKKRVTEIYAQLSEFQSENYLFLHDKRGSYHWMKLDEQLLNREDEIDKILQEIAKIYMGDIYLWPHGNLVNSFRAYFSSKDSEEIYFNNTFITVPLSSYNSCFEFGMKMQEKFFTTNNLPKRNSKSISHIDLLESESIHIIREVVSSAQNPVMLYSLGKDSSVMLHLAQKAFFPGKLPFPLMHVDTKWKFKEMYDFRDKIVQTLDSDLIVFSNQDGIDKNINPIDHGSSLHTNIMKTEALKMALDKYKFDFAFGGARRDEEKSRAKERIFSLRNETHSWNPKNQRPELWNKYNCKLSPNENVRVFPLSNWTEIDIWHYIYREKIEIVPLYFSSPRPVTTLGDALVLVDDERIDVEPEDISIKNIRFRTLGCYPLSGAIESNAKDLESVISEIIESNYEERQGRTIDTDSDSSMEKKKIEGYF